ncbi:MULTISPECIES: DNA-directed DNA polymerase II small subunit [Haloferax]|uniref:DNA polymerase II small subunit n=2 Tax=Haloferax TaxID=2251 RepID=A0A6G1YZS6_9EURY|nr:MULTISPECIES: DNA-directed DNA polymerase II small subunit [Haloferax]KAB1187139.1 DNA-directed DNA polymerase II small subunit [Haloferax sp. CBA1149]MRW79776.1 DNA-directed DNA polymerase II small subunit [Haloferax marinisediminis]
MPLETPARIVRALVSRGYNAEREAVTLIAGSDDPGVTLAQVVDSVPDDALRITADHVREVLASAPAADPPGTAAPSAAAATDPSVSAATSGEGSEPVGKSTPNEAKVSAGGRTTDPTLRSLEIANDMTGQSTGTGEYDDFVKVFRDRYEKLSKMLRGRVNHRPAKAISKMSGGEDAELIGLVNDVRSTKSGHWIVELEDTTGTFPCLVMKDKDIASYVNELLLDECIAVQGTLSGDAGILFVDSMHFPDVPRGHRPNTADRHVQAALISDVHVGSQEFMAEAWNRFADWLHTEEAEHVEYLLIAGDMVEGVGVYPNQDEELDVIDIYDQYETFSEHLKSVPGDLDIVMIPGNHDAVRLAEPQPGFDDELRDIMSAHDAKITSNPSMVTLEGVNILMYHGVSLDEVIAELPAEKASYDEPHKAMYQLLKKRHVAPQFGGHTRLAPEKLDYLVMEDVPDIFHTGHVHKLGWGKYHNVLAVNSGCWQSQTDFQKSVNIDPDSGYAPIVDLDTLNMTVRKFS